MLVGSKKSGPAWWSRGFAGRLMKEAGRLDSACQAGSGSGSEGRLADWADGARAAHHLFSSSSFLRGRFFGPTGHRRPISPPLSSSFHWRAGPAWQRVLLLFLLLSPPPTGLEGAHGQGRGLCGGEVKARRGHGRARVVAAATTARARGSV